MGIFSRLFGRPETPSVQEADVLVVPKQSLIVRFEYELPSEEPYCELDEDLFMAFRTEYDGHATVIDGSDSTLFFYGPDADVLLKMAAPILLKYPFMKGAECTRRYGGADDENALEITTELGRLPS